MLENIGFAWQGIWLHKMRSLLTMLGIIIGIAAIIAIVSTIKGTAEKLREQLIGGRNHIVDVKLMKGDSEYDPTYDTEQVPALTDETKNQIKAIEGVENASFYYERTSVDGIYYLNNSFSGGTLHGVDREYLNTNSYQLQTGRWFVEGDYSRYRKVALMDRDAVKTLFPEGNPLGKTIEIGSEPFIIVGVYFNPHEYVPEINSKEEYDALAEDKTGTILIPDVCWSIVYQFDEPQNVILRAANTDAMGKAGSKASEVLNGIFGDNYQGVLKYQNNDIMKQIKDQQDLNKQTNRQLIWIAGISLLVGGIGVMNIMLVSVTERTSEIGLKKAVGAKKRAILEQFLVEAAMLTSLGGIFGVVAGIGMSKIISKVADIPVAISIPASIGAVAFSMLIGIIFGFLPSMKAANLNPIDALRSE